MREFRHYIRELLREAVADAIFVLGLFRSGRGIFETVHYLLVGMRAGEDVILEMNRATGNLIARPDAAAMSFTIWATD